MIAQRGLFAGPNALVHKDLYAQTRSGAATRRRTTLGLEPSTEVTCNTYFGRFPASYWQRWTGIEAVAVELQAHGEGLVRLAASDLDGEPRIVAAHEVSGAKRVVLTAKLDRFFDGGALWLEAETEPGQRLEIEDVRWVVPSAPRLRPTAITICTMNRPEDCLSTVTTLTEDAEAFAAIDRIYVVDQGNEHPDFPALDKLTYLRQPNLGGAGGFTRGLYEISGDASEHSNVLFMDDDIMLEPDLVIRMTAFSASTPEPLILGGQMLNMLHPTQLHAAAEYTDLDRIRPGMPIPHSLHAADMLTHRQERRVDAGYNGWWACLIPHEVVKETGYPLPLFFQGDDAEYSYRAREHGFPTITLPGAGLWHTDFPWKDRDEINRYFILRNYTIISALHGSFPVAKIVTTLAAELVPYLLGMQYGAAATLIQAVEDFLAGPEILSDGGVNALRRIRELRAEYPETKALPATALPGIASNDIEIAEPGKRPGYAAVAHKDAKWWRIAALRTAIVTDAAQKGVRVRGYDQAKLARLTRRGASVLARFAREGEAVREKYRNALPQLSSRANWTRLLEIS